MTRPETTVISTTEARLAFSEIMERARYGDERFIVEEYGEPHVVIISVQAYETLLQRVEELEDARDMAQVQGEGVISLHEYGDAEPGSVVYQVFLRRQAAEELGDVPHRHHRQILDSLVSLEKNPRPGSAVAIANDIYRVRVDAWRVIYQVDDDERRVSVGKIARRG
jgi:mRNA interferase RelE/StbE